MVPGSAPLFVEMLREPFLRYALVAGLLAGSVCAFLGTYVILRRIVFLGLALSQAAALGVALGLFAGWNPEATASGLTLLTALLFSLFSVPRRAPLRNQAAVSPELRFRL